MRPLSCALFAGLVLASAGPSPRPAAQSDPAAVIDFPNSGRAAAQKDFREGVFLLHSFEYNDAREAFSKAQKIDPGFALLSPPSLAPSPSQPRSAWAERQALEHQAAAAKVERTVASTPAAPAARDTRDVSSPGRASTQGP